VIKVSGACTLSREPYPFPDIWDPLARVFDAWGFERCLWGTDWTRAYAVVNYEQAIEPFLKTDRLSDSERAMLMGGACAKAYRGRRTKSKLVKIPAQQFGRFQTAHYLRQGALAVSRWNIGGARGQGCVERSGEWIPRCNYSQ
jgi:Amidohydrolase